MNAKGFLGLVGVGAILLGAFDLTSTGRTIAVVLAVAFLPSELVELVEVARHRKDVSNFIQSHAAEIQTAA